MPCHGKDIDNQIQKLSLSLPLSILRGISENELNLIKEKTPDVVVMEILLPQLDGFAVIEKIRQENIKTKIIVQSSLSMNGFINKAKRGIRKIKRKLIG